MGSCWAELSGDLERSIARFCTMKDVINLTILKGNKEFGDIEIDDDGYHFFRSCEGEER